MISSISAWVLSIACIICLSVLVELILPSGQMNKYIKGIFSFFVLFVIISPIPKLLNLNINGDSFLDYGFVQVDEDYIAQLNMDKLTSLTKSAEDAITELGYENSVVSLEADMGQDGNSSDYSGADLNDGEDACDDDDYDEDGDDEDKVKDNN